MRPHNGRQGPPDISALRTFGCEAWMLREGHLDKLGAKAFRYVYFGPDYRRHADTFWDLDAKKLRYSRSARFNEQCFPFAGDPGGDVGELFGDSLAEPPSTDDDAPAPEEPVPAPPDAPLDQIAGQEERLPVAPGALLEPAAAPQPAIGRDRELEEPQPVEEARPVFNRPLDALRGLSEADRELVVRLNMDALSDEDLTGPEDGASGLPEPPPIPPADGEAASVAPRRTGRHRKRSTFLKYPSEINAMTADPKTFRAAMESPFCDEWRRTARCEFETLGARGTWTLVELPPNQRAISCTWVWKTKRGPDGEVIRWKARICGHGFLQRHGMDYAETFAPVVKIATVRAVLAVAASFDFEIDHLDVVSAFLNAKLEEECYMQQPRGFVVKGKEKAGVPSTPRALWVQAVVPGVELGTTRDPDPDWVHPERL